MSQAVSRRLAITIALVAIAGTPLAMTAAEACTRILWNNNKLAVVASRTMDWPESTEPILTVFPRGISRTASHVGPVEFVKDNPAKWTSDYGSIVTSIYGLGAVDGLNEKGLAMHLLYLNSSDFGARDASKPGLIATLWGQYVLDKATNVAEALKLLEGVQVIKAEARGHQSNVHLALEDASGDSAIIEYIDGKPVVHHGREYTIMTNDPPYDQQIALLKKQDYSKPSSEMSLPGNVNATDRFQRAAYYSALLPEPRNEREAIAGVLAIARNVSVPFGAPYKGFGIYNTEYRTAIDLTKRLYFFELTTTPSVIWTDLLSFDLSAGAPVQELNPDNINLSGNVTDKFKKVVQAPF